MKNKYEVRGNITAVFLNRKDGTVLETLISTSDLPKLMAYHTTWFANWDSKGNRFYAQANSLTVNGRRKGIRLHRFLMNAPKDMVVDHMNHDTLDNRRENLRIVDQFINMQHRDGLDKNNTSGVRGVYWNNSKQKWIVQIKHYNKTFWKAFKDFDSAVECAEKKRSELHDHQYS